MSCRLFEPQNIEQGISNIEVTPSTFCGSLFCCSIFSALNHLSSVLCRLVPVPASPCRAKWPGLQGLDFTQASINE